MRELLKNIFKQILQGDGRIDRLTEGVFANEYNEHIQAEIRQQYLQRWYPEYQPKTPLTHPWLFDPCEPPEGWRYDPYYETWLKFGDAE